MVAQIQIKNALPPIARLHYKSGDLIIKQGDYGLSIYKVIKGKVRIFRESGGKEVSLATLGPGEVIGEMSFFNRSLEPRSASARALTDVELEAWHPARLAREYDQMPPIIKLIADKMLSRLIKTNTLIGKLGAKLEESRAQNRLGAEPKGSGRRFYRKQVDLDCTYRPLDAPPKVRYPGKIKDISLAGIGMEVNSISRSNTMHDLGELLYVSTVLPNNKEVDFIVKIVDIRKGRLPGRLFLGMAYVDVSEDSRKKLGFFMMP
ncbi:MAG: hypothetical protein DRH12_03965 [Deltaproteobacteria bacterium]|nr:MAG: hypothetical protein DRH12_03965 [Deltaproteobacteria bacterium]